MSAVVHEYRTCLKCNQTWEIVFLSLFKLRSDGMRVFSTTDGPIYLTGRDGDCPNCSGGFGWNSNLKRKDVPLGNIIIWDERVI